MNINNSLRNSLIVTVCFFALASCNQKTANPSQQVTMLSVSDTLKQKATLQKILNDLPPDRVSNGRLSFLDETFQDWIKRTGELPPDFETIPSIPFLPDPLVLDEGRTNIPVKTMDQWKEKRAWMKDQLECYITGTYPPKPENLEVKILNEKQDGGTIVRMVELTFGPEHKAKLTVEMMIPPGNGPFPVFLTQWNHREWAMVAVRRGYIGCVYAGADAKDDTEAYSEIWAGEYDFTRLMRRAFGAYRAIDYLYTLPYVDKDKIGITGHSRNGKLSLMAAAFDERITACIPSSGGTGAEVPWRYNSTNYDVEDITMLSTSVPAWLHPRLRFFIGRENKLPVDQNLFMALIAPRGLMLSTAINEGASNPWGIEQAYHDAQKVYKFLGQENNLAIRSRYGLHSVAARDMEDYIDFFDYVFKRSDHKPENRLFYNYSFDRWTELSGEKINPQDYPVRNPDDLAVDAQNNKITSVASWEKKKSEIRKNIQWGLGDEPAGVINPGPELFNKRRVDENSFGSFLERPRPTETMGRMHISPYSGFGDQLFGTLYFPGDKNGDLKSKNLPVVIYLHEYDYSKGFNSYHQVESLFQSMVDKGFAVFSYDMLGFGNRIEEGTRFYNRYPHWSKMGKMVVDVRGAVDALSNLDFVDDTKIYVAGYSLGATVGLYATALDERIAGLVSVAGFTPMRLSTPEKGTEGVKAYSHLHGLLPRLGFFIGNESRIPYDFHEILASIAPRQVLVIAPQTDKDANLQDVKNSVEKARAIYSLYGAADNIELFAPDDYNRFSPAMREKTYEWLQSKRVSHQP
ncbi:MAG: alpha/beta fold hydrolase [Cyclobacteriaceae bacterium]